MPLGVPAEAPALPPGRPTEVRIVALDGVCNALDDPARLAAEAEQGAGLGYDGKTLIHPQQIGPANQAFAPGAAEVGRARAIILAY